VAANPSHRILIIAGEASGDLHGSNLIRELKNMDPGLTFFGIGGNRMKKEGTDLLFHIDKLSFMGFSEVLKNLGFVRKVMKAAVAEAERREPDLAVLIDYPGFNLRLARKLKDLGIPVVYYISPQVWAWGGNRVKKMRDLIDMMIVVFPFEKAIYDQYGIECRFVGHPFLDTVRPILSPDDFRMKFDIRKNDVAVGLLPGSRWQEVEKILPVMLESTALLSRRIRNLRLLLGLAPTIEKEKIEEMLKACPLKVTTVENLTHDVMKHSHLLLVASGSATLECAILGTPFLVLYKTSLWTYLVARSLVSIPDIALANVVAGKSIVPEFIQNKAQPVRVSDEMYDLLNDREKYRLMQQDLAQVKGELGEPGASAKAARIVAEMLPDKSSLSHEG
jgi:lipid-A-disaccharide synthase